MAASLRVNPRALGLMAAKPLDPGLYKSHGFGFPNLHFYLEDEDEEVLCAEPLCTQCIHGHLPDSDKTCFLMLREILRGQLAPLAKWCTVSACNRHCVKWIVEKCCWCAVFLHLMFMFYFYSGAWSGILTLVILLILWKLSSAPTTSRYHLLLQTVGLGWVYELTFVFNEVLQFLCRILCFLFSTKCYIWWRKI